jgi:hypothetical protein
VTDWIVYAVIALAAVLGVLSATGTLAARRRLERKLDRIIALLENESR